MGSKANLFDDLPETAGGTGDSGELRGHMGERPGPHMNTEGALAEPEESVFGGEAPRNPEAPATIGYVLGPDGIPMPTFSGAETDAVRASAMLFADDDERADLTICTRDRCRHHTAQIVTVQDADDPGHRQWRHICRATGLDITKDEIQACSDYEPKIQFATVRRVIVAATSASALMARLEGEAPKGVVQAVVRPLDALVRWAIRAGLGAAKAAVEVDGVARATDNDKNQDKV